MNNKSPTERATEIYHHGIKGQKWGVRRFQNPDGTLTAEGKKRYDDGSIGNDTSKKKNRNSRAEAIKKYNEAYSDWEATQNLADQKWTDVQVEYKKLGKSRVSQIMNAAFGKSEAAKKYSKAYDDWEATQNLADRKWTTVQDRYRETGKNLTSRVLNGLFTGRYTRMDAPSAKQHRRSIKRKQLV